jgi:predicted ABC-type ATPase
LLDLDEFQATPSLKQLQDFFSDSTLLKIAGLSGVAARLRLDGTQLRLDRVDANSYVASVLSDFLRRYLLDAQVSFTFETVMSSRDKVDFLRVARDKGFRVYLYFVATSDPEINISRVHNRVLNGGHAVPEEKIRERYYRSLSLLLEAISCSNRAYIFDNSLGLGKRSFVAEITDGSEVTVIESEVPDWFSRHVFDQGTHPPQ